MLEKIKLYVTFKIPVWLVIVILAGLLYGWDYLEPKPPKTLIPIKLDGVERMLGKSQDAFTREYLYIDVLEYRSIYRIVYGKLTDEEEKLFDHTLSKFDK